MATTENPLAVGVFRDPTLAEQTIDTLRQAGFRDDEIRVWGQGKPGTSLKLSDAKCLISNARATWSSMAVMEKMICNTFL